MSLPLICSKSLHDAAPVGRLLGGMPAAEVGSEMSDVENRAVDLIVGERITDPQLQVTVTSEHHYYLNFLLLLNSLYYPADVEDSCWQPGFKCLKHLNG